MKDVQCYELFGGIALKNHAFSFSFLSGGRFTPYFLGSMVDVKALGLPHVLRLLLW